MSGKATPPARGRAIPSWLLPALLLAVIGAASWYFVFRESDAERVQRLVAEGRQAMDANDFVVAEARLREALETSPESGILMHNLAVAYVRQNRLEDARNMFHRAAAAYGPEANEVRAEEYFQLATLSVNAKEWDRAVQELKQAIASHPTREMLYARLLDLQLGPAKDANGADSTTSMFLRSCGRTAANLSAAAYVHFQNESYGQSEALARQAVAVSDSTWDAHATLARTLAKTGRADLGLRHLEPVLERHPGVAELWVAKGQLLLTRELRTAALEAADRAIEIAPRSFETHRLRQMALAGLARLDEALAELAIARDLTQDPAVLRQLLADQKNLRLAQRMQEKLQEDSSGDVEKAP